MALANGLHRLRRLERVEKTIASMPLDRRTTAKALQHFLATGELPQNEQYAAAVVYRTVSGLDEQEWEGMELILRAMARARENGDLKLVEPPEPPPTRERLLWETLDPKPSVRRAARRAVRELVADGRDLQDESLLSDLEITGDVAGLRVLAYLEGRRVRPAKTRARSLPTKRRGRADRPPVRQSP